MYSWSDACKSLTVDSAIKDHSNDFHSTVSHAPQTFLYTQPDIGEKIVIFSYLTSFWRP